MGDHGASKDLERDDGAATFGKEHGEIHEAIVTGRSVGAGKGFWSTLAHDKYLFADVFALYLKKANRKVVDININYDKPPIIPSGWSIRKEDQISSRMRGQWSVNELALYPYLSKEQRSNNVTIRGSALLGILSGEEVVPANLLDFYLAHPTLIPEDWKRRHTYFWGTIFRNENYEPCVRCITHRCDGSWYAKHELINKSFGMNEFALIHIRSKRITGDCVTRIDKK